MEYRKKEALKNSFRLEARADMCAASRDISSAFAHMRAANLIRRDIFCGVTDPNRLRELAKDAIDAPGQRHD